MKHICELSSYCGEVRSRDFWPEGYSVLCGKAFYMKTVVYSSISGKIPYWRPKRVSESDVCTNAQGILLYFSVK